jgi:NAD(P)-dependent dehydrogenase (short-subunit alcohol dehydrogenase family)
MDTDPDPTRRFRLDGKVALVTGATGNIGSEIARGLARAGAEVIATSRTVASLEQVVAEIAGTGGRASYLACDLRDRAAVARLAEQALARAGHVDIIVNDAMPSGGLDAFLDLTDEQWSLELDVMFWAPMVLCRSLAPALIARGGGSIINIGSAAGHTPYPRHAAYGVAKAALHHLTRYLAAELGPHNIRANVLNPGTIVPRSGPFAEWEQIRVIDRVSLKRYGALDEVVGLAIFLASDATAHDSGHMIAADGGRF